MKGVRVAALWAVVSSVLSAVVVVPPARAAEGPRTSSLGWVRLGGAESCIGPGPLAKAVEARLRRAIFVSAARADVAVEGRIEKTPGGFRAVIAVSDATGALLGSREVARDGEPCSALDEELALVIAVLLDPEAALAPAPPAPAPPPPPPPVIVHERVVVEVPVETPPREPLRFHVGGGLSLGVGALPGVAVGATVRAGVIPARLPAVELYGSLWGKRHAEGASGAGASDISLTYAGVLVCPLVGTTSRVRAMACAGGEVGSLIARGVNVDVSREDESLYAALVLAGRAHVALWGPLGLGLGVSLGAPLRRDAFYYRDAAGDRLDLFRPSAVTATADVGLVLVYPP